MAHTFSEPGLSCINLVAHDESTFLWASSLQYAPNLVDGRQISLAPFWMLLHPAKFRTTHVALNPRLDLPPKPTWFAIQKA